MTAQRPAENARSIVDRLVDASASFDDKLTSEEKQALGLLVFSFNEIAEGGR